MANSQFALAIHILTMLARSPECNVKSDHIAASANTNAVVIRRLIGQMAHAGLVFSQTGAQGGTRLSRPPQEITLCEIYRAVSRSEVLALRPTSPNKECPVGRNIEFVLCSIQKEIDNSICETLLQYNLKNIIEIFGKPES